MKTLLLLGLTCVILTGCAFTLSTDGTKAGTRGAVSFQPSVQDFKAWKEL